MRSWWRHEQHSIRIVYNHSFVMVDTTRDALRSQKTVTRTGLTTSLWTTRSYLPPGGGRAALAEPLGHEEVEEHLDVPVPHMVDAVPVTEGILPPLGQRLLCVLPVIYQLDVRDLGGHSDFTRRARKGTPPRRVREATHGVAALLLELTDEKSYTDPDFSLK